MHGWGTDEYTLTGLDACLHRIQSFERFVSLFLCFVDFLAKVCTLPENLYDEIHGLYEKEHGRLGA